jgi:RHS repeat-associated core domain
VSGNFEPTFTAATTDTIINNDNNQMAAWTHDANGNVTSDGVFTYTWDALGRLLQVERDNTVVAVYAYDSQNRWISKTVGEQTIHYHYDLNNHLIAESLADGTPLREYLYLDNEPLAMREYQINPGCYYFINDHLGTPQQLVTTTGTVVWQAAYLPYGEVQVQINTVTNNLRFPGQYFDVETGLHYNWNRYYDPVTGRYISADPIGLEGGLNLYAYVGGNPVNWVDPEGLEWQFSQSTGQWSHVNNQTGAVTNVGQGYSGTGEGRNNTAMQNVPNVGLTPQGTYDIGPAYNHRNLGPMTMNLTPQSGTNTFGRDLFRIHGDNTRHDASEGCAIAPPNVRQQINNSNDRVLRVVP